MEEEALLTSQCRTSRCEIQTLLNNLKINAKLNSLQAYVLVKLFCVVRSDSMEIEITNTCELFFLCWSIVLIGCVVGLLVNTDQ